MFAPAHGWLSAAMARFALHGYSDKQLLSIISNKQAFKKMATAMQTAVNLSHRRLNEWHEDNDYMEGNKYRILVLNEDQLNVTVRTARATMNLAEIGEITILQRERSTTSSKSAPVAISDISQYWSVKPRKRRAGRVVGDEYFDMQSGQGCRAYQQKLATRTEGDDVLGLPAQVSRRAKQAARRARRAAKRERRPAARETGNNESTDQQPAQLRGGRGTDERAVDVGGEVDA